MATKTTNLQLDKPDYTDAADIAVINGDLDKIDTAVKAVQDSISNAMMTERDDVDAIRSTGLYYCSTNAQNLPDNRGGGMVSIAANANTFVQLFIENDGVSPNVYVRRRTSTIIGGWRKI